MQPKGSNEEFTLTLLDIAIYVAGHEGNDVLGRCRCLTQGLLARVLRTKYPELRARRVRVYEWTAQIGQWHSYWLSPEVYLAGYIFDERTGKQWREDVQKHEFLAAWSAWFATKSQETSV